MPTKHTLWQLKCETKAWFREWTKAGEMVRQEDHKARREEFLTSFPDGETTELGYEALPQHGAVDGSPMPLAIRLLTLLPGRELEEIRCTLAISDTSAAFEALSYCWTGAADGRPPITVNGVKMQVTRNLKAALADLRRPDRERVLWVDAVCINQLDMAERESQVRHMDEIYRRAVRTVVYLGEPSAHNDLAFDALLAMANLYDRVRGEEEWDPAWVLERYQETVGTRLGGDFGAFGEEAVAELIKKKWFTRMWVLQEVALGQDVTVTCGPRDVAWDVLAKGMSMKIMLDVLLQKASWSNRSTAGVLRFIALRDRVRDKGNSLDLLTLLNHVRSLDATNNLDKAYAIFGLTRDMARLGILPKYDLTAAQLYTNIAAAIISDTNSLDILSIPRSSTSSGLSGELPSWVPDWSDRVDFPRSFLERGRGNTGADSETIRPFYASAKFVVSQARTEPYNCNNSRNTTTTALTISGFIFDRISRLSNPMPSNTTADNAIGQWRESADNMTAPALSLVASFPRACYSATKDLAALGGVQVEWAWFLYQNGFASFFSTPASQVYGPTGENTVPAAVRTISADTISEASLERPDMLMYFLKISTRTKATWNQVRRLGMWLPHFEVDEIDTAGLPEMALGRRLAVTQGGYLCLAPAGAREGDAVVLARGGRLPLVLREVETGASELVGDCYVHGIMYGEAFEEDKCQTIRLI